MTKPDHIKSALDELFAGRRPSKWVTREHPKIDRIACPWAIRRFIDPDAVVDTLEQCLHMGDLRHAVAEGVMTAQDVHADLGDVVIGARPGRTAGDDVFIFDSTGTALQDVASAALAYERASERGFGLPFTLY